MTFLSFLLVALLGYAAMNSISQKFSFMEKLGFAFPIGIGITSLLMFLFNLLGLPLNQNFVLLIGLILVLSAFFFSNRKIFTDLNAFFSLGELKFPGKGEFNLAWLFLVACIITLVSLIVLKGQFWPVFIYDSVAGYDFLGRAIAFEGTIHISLFETSSPLYTVRDLYPPLIPLAFSFAYSSGALSSQIIISLFVISLPLCFYTLQRKFVTHFAAAFFTLLLIITPQLAAFSSLSSPSIPSAFYCAMAILCLFIWQEQEREEFFFLGTLLMIFALWTRSEAIAFAITGFLIVLLRSLQREKKFYLLVYGISCAIVFVAWQFYLSQVLEVGSEQPLIRHLYFDGGKISRMMSGIFEILSRTAIYGFSIWVFMVALVLNSVLLFKKRDRLQLLLSIFISFILLVGVYYQIDVDYKDQGSLSYLTSGFMRSMFSFLPLMFFYAAVNSKAILFFASIKGWLMN